MTMTNLAHRFLLSVTLAYGALIVVVVAAFSGVSLAVKAMLLVRSGSGSGPSSDALLLETGDYLLLESGDFLLLE